ncbi:MCE family protein [Mycolicibacter heraklionensis]|uniref:MCE family protein n=1 Tax=Mycolicibacter heraklionensis TaxID=512402 RepID=UPI0007EBA1C6|nr:MlaD family protein [Mycolicibacter heraklionensis]OBG32248.1 mammalian cell entry protein [Mycolicibacter heraklionensis]
MGNALTTPTKKFFRDWRTRPLESYNTTWLGFGALAVVAVVVAAALFVKVIGFGYTRYTAEFAQAAALAPGNPIMVAGIEVGRVTSMRLAGDHVVAGLTVRNDVPLGKDTRAKIQVMTILGSRYLKLEPDGPGSLPGKRINLAHTEVPYSLESLLEDATTTFDQVDSDQFGQSLAVLGQQLSGLPPVVPQAMANLHALSKITADRRDQLGTLLASTQRVANTLRNQQTNLGNLVDQGQDFIGELVARQNTFHAMLAALTSLVGQLNNVVVTDRSMLDDMLVNLRALSDMLGQHDDLLRSLIQSAPPPLRGITNATGYGPGIEFFAGNGIAIDSWMCAISGRAKQFGMIEYFKDCK